MNCDMSLLVEGLSKWGINIEPGTVHKFREYMLLILERNDFVNLTSIVDPKNFIVNHFLDSLSIVKSNCFNPSGKLIDIGTGAGFPGIPLKILFPQIYIVLVDSVKKRTLFLEEVIYHLNLTGIEVVTSRAEILAHGAKYRESFDFAVSRAVAELRVLSEYCIPFVRPGGYFIAYKGPAAESELEMAREAIKILGGGDVFIQNIDVPFSDRVHRLVCIKKLTKSPKKYPRRPGKPKKSPL